MFVFFIGFFSLFLKFGRFIFILISFEFMMMGIFCVLSFFFSFFGFFYFLCFSVLCSLFGVVLMVYFIKFYGCDYVFF
uniref:NADH dehydrogenase subunit 4L n=1 Tax=Strongyloides sp. EN-2020b TaxID=2725240 RepID=A0A6J4CWG1_9BILA|nr:NADH dehydrogenase subunit 4L [Strongyloides sp. EN-2020b]